MFPGQGTRFKKAGKISLIDNISTTTSGQRAYINNMVRHLYYIRVMLYHKHSFNYWIRILLWMRLRVLVKILSRAGRWNTDRRRVDGPLVGLRGNQDRRVWDLHYRNFLQQGWAYLRPSRFVHHCTDGPECPIAFAFSKAGARQLFARFSKVELKVAHFPLRKYSRWIPFALEKLLAPRLGWYLFIYAGK